MTTNHSHIDLYRYEVLSTIVLATWLQELRIRVPGVKCAETPSTPLHPPAKGADHTRGEHGVGPAGVFAGGLRVRGAAGVPGRAPGPVTRFNEGGQIDEQKVSYTLAFRL